jgi:magnesium chelatase subunit I
MGRVEFESFEEGREAEILDQLARKAVVDVFRRRLGGFDFSGLLARFDEGLTVESSDMVPTAALLKEIGDVKGVPNLLKRLGVEEESPALAASGLEFALEGLHLSKRLNKSTTATGIRYGS